MLPLLTSFIRPSISQIFPVVYSSQFFLYPFSSTIRSRSSESSTHLESRPVTISRVRKSAAQQGTSGTNMWQITFDWGSFDSIGGGRHRWIDPNTGWVSTSDPLTSLKLKFSSPKEAIEYCEKQGFQFRVLEENLPVRHIQDYADNFKYQPAGPRTDSDSDYE